jgi:urea transport system substrate-binding protein
MASGFWRINRPGRVVGARREVAGMRRVVLTGVVLLAALTSVDFAVAWARGTLPILPIRQWIAPPPSPIVVGLVHSRTGPLAISELSLLDAEILALKEVNAQGGVAGREVRWEVADGRSDPATFASQALRLIEERKVEAIFGGWTAECRKAMLEVIEERGNLLIFPANFEGIERSSRAIYVGGSANQVVPPAVRWCFDERKARRFFVVGSEEVWSRVASEIAKDAIKAAGGELVGESYQPLTASDAQPLVESIRVAKPDVVLNTLVGDFNLPFYAAFRRAGLTPDAMPIVAFAVAEDELRRFPPGDATGHYSALSYFESSERPESLAFVRKFKAEYGNDRVISDTMVSAYDGVLLWAQAADESGTADPRIVAGRFDRQTLDAPEGVVTIDPESRIAWRPFILGKARSDGKFDLASSMIKPIHPVTYVATRPKARWQTFLEDLKAQWGGRWSSAAK